MCLLFPAHGVFLPNISKTLFTTLITSLIPVGGGRRRRSAFKKTTKKQGTNPDGARVVSFKNKEHLKKKLKNVKKDLAKKAKAVKCNNMCPKCCKD